MQTLYTGKWKLMTQGAYQAAPMASPSVSDPYMSNYYNPMSFPYLSQGIGTDAGAWSNGGDMGFLSYGQMGGDYVSNNGMFPGFDYNQAAFTGWGFTNSDYTWGVPQQGRKDSRSGYSDEYYHPESMGPSESYTVNGDMDRGRELQNVEQGLQGMTIGAHEGMPNEGVKENVQPVANHEGYHEGYHEAPSNTSPSGSSTSAPSQAPKKMTWASIASQPAKPQPQLKAKSIPRAPVPPKKQNMDIGTWDTKNNGSKGTGGPRPAWGAPRGRPASQPYSTGPSNSNAPLSDSGNAGLANISNPSVSSCPSHPVLDKLRSANQYNPREMNLNTKNARYFIIKSYSEDDIHRSIKYSIWCSTEHGNRRLSEAFREREGKGPIYLLYSVNGSGHFCGVGQMMSNVDTSKSSGVWAQDKWKGQFEVKWIYVKDVPNSQLRHIRLENNENKPVTNSRDTQEVPAEKGRMVLKIIHQYCHNTSIFDDFGHYEKRQEEDQEKPPSSSKVR